MMRDFFYGVLGWREDYRMRHHSRPYTIGAGIHSAIIIGGAYVIVSFPMFVAGYLFGR